MNMHFTAASASVQSLLLPDFWTRVKQWGGKVSVAVVDQGVMTGSNFVVGILLARWLAPAQYGAYAIAYALFLLLSLFFQALVLEPMSIFGPSGYRQQLPIYFGVLVRASLGLATLLVLVLAACSWMEYSFLQNHVLAMALVGMAMATPCVILLWLARNAFYVKLSPMESAVGGLLYSGLLLSGIFIAHSYHYVSPFATFLLMAIGGLTTALLQLRRLSLVYGLTPEVTLKSVAREHWNYGRWILASSFVVWIPSNIYYLVFSGHVMMSSAAELRALLNLTLPVGQTAAALTLLLQPYAAQRQDRDGSASMVSLVHRVTLLYAAGATIYWIALIVFRTQAFHVLYGNKYLALSPLLPFVALSSILAVAAHGPGIGLRAIRSPASVFASFCAPSAISLLVGIPAALFFGITGTVLTLVLANMVAMFFVMRSFYRRLREALVQEPMIAVDPLISATNY